MTINGYEIGELITHPITGIILYVILGAVISYFISLL